jgi:hypothetical protein
MYTHPSDVIGRNKEELARKYPKIYNRLSGEEVDLKNDKKGSSLVKLSKNLWERIKKFLKK